MYTIPTLSRTAMHYTYNTTTTDSIPDGLLTGTTLFDKSTVSYSYDYLQRLSNKLLKSESGTTLLEERFAYAAGSGENTTTNRVSTKRNFWNGTLINQFQHGYDALGNIVSIVDPLTSSRIEYEYDDQGQLLEAVHKTNNVVTRTETYTYDNVGNILTFNNGTTSHTYTYGDTQWRDLLTAVDGNEITYDASGNPTEYYNEWPMTWVEGRRLESVTTSEGKYTYEYNADGQRTKKTNPDGTYIEYYVMDGITVGESHFSATGSKTLGIRYTFDENNSVIGFTTGGQNYYFAKNLQGDVLEVYNASTNEVVAQYTYDSWGNILTATGSMKDTNPFRYRSYYYDEETNFYYLQSRYYDAAIGRFINADDNAYLGVDGTPVSYNLYAYCLNNPINCTDSSGKFAISALVGAVVGGAVAGALIGAVSYLVNSVLNGSEVTAGGLIGAIGIGALNGAIGGAAGSLGVIGKTVLSVGAGIVSGIYTAVNTEGSVEQKIAAGISTGVIATGSTFVGASIDTTGLSAGATAFVNFSTTLAVAAPAEMLAVGAQQAIKNIPTSTNKSTELRTSPRPVPHNYVAYSY